MIALPCRAGGPGGVARPLPALCLGIFRPSRAMPFADARGFFLEKST